MSFKSVPIITETKNGQTFQKLLLNSYDDSSYPGVSIITITYNRSIFNELMLRNWRSINYPADKLEWIIINDGTEPVPSVDNNDKRIRIINSSDKLPLGMKRNLGAKLASYNLICHFDSDDFYPDSSVIARVRGLLTTNAKCIGCQYVNCYDLLTNKTFESYDISTKTISESTMLYTKDFWTQRNFLDEDTNAECLYFLKDRKYDDVVVIPSSFVITQFTHNTNTITRRPTDATFSNILFMNTLPAKDEIIINNIIAQLIKKEDPQLAVIMATLSMCLNNVSGIEKVFKSMKSKYLKSRPVVEFRRQYYSSSLQNYNQKQKDDIVYYCGGSYEFFNFKNKWDPYSQILGGSEEAVIGLSERFVEMGRKVTVYCNCDHSIIVNGVKYEQVHLWTPLNKSNVTIIWRDPYVFKEVKKINADKIFLDLHDALTTTDLVHVPNYTTIMVKSKFHKSITSDGSGSNRIVVVPNGINADTDDATKGDKKETIKLLCTSSPDRCLIGLLQALPLIRKEIPNVELYWAYGFKAGTNDGGLEVIETQWTESVRNLMASMESEGFINLDRKTQQEINVYYKNCDYFIYGTHFPEIDCISLTKACYYGLVPIVTDTGAMKEKIEYLNDCYFKLETTTTERGIDKSLNENNSQFKDWVQYIITTINKTKQRNTRNVLKNKISLKYNLKSIAQQWSHLFLSTPTPTPPISDDSPEATTL